MSGCSCDAATPYWVNDACTATAPTPTCPTGSSTTGTGDATNVSGCNCDAATPYWVNDACTATAPTPTCPTGSSTTGTGDATNVSGCNCDAATPYWVNDACTATPSCSQNEYLDGTTCKACENGGTAAAGANVCTCPPAGNWDGPGCAHCSLTGTNINTTTCTCEDVTGTDGTTCYAAIDKCTDQTNDTCNACSGNFDPASGCTTCADGYMMPTGTNICVPSITCNNGTQTGDGICTCNTGWADNGNNKCSVCANGFAHYGDPNGCYESINCNGHGEQYGASCKCYNHWEGTNCERCPTGYDEEHNCIAVNSGTQLTGKQAATNADGIVLLNNADDRKVYGLENTGTVNAGSGEIRITNNGSGEVYGVYSANKSWTSSNHQDSPAEITLSNTGDGNVYGIYSTGTSNSVQGAAGSNATNTITISNTSVSAGGNVYGIYAQGNVVGAAGSNGVNNIDILNTGSGNVYGLYSASGTVAGATGSGISSNNVDIMSVGTGKLYGLYSEAGAVYSNHTSETASEINISSAGSKTAYGIYTKGDAPNGYATNAAGDTITINALGVNYTKTGDETPPTPVADNGVAIGIYVNQNASATNAGDIAIKREAWIDDKGTESTADDITYTPVGTGGSAFGMYVEGGNATSKTVTNSGNIVISGNFTNAYGIYVADGTNVTVVNDGTIDLTNATCSGTCQEVVSNGGPLIQAGVLSLTSLNATASNLQLASSSHTYVTDAFTGEATIMADTVTNGFNTTYTEHGMINAGDTSELNLVSGSALFDAKLEGNDVVMQMKGFDTATTNKSLSKFLSDNYALQNNEKFYNRLKSFDNTDALTDSLNKLTGKEMLSRFNFEDMTMMRELNFDMNEKLFHNKEQHFALSGSVSPMAFRGDNGSNARYSLYNKRDGHKSIGLGVAFTNVRSDDTHDNDNRSETMYQLILPIGYKTHGFNLVTSPRIGYARGTYDRTGFDGQNYDGLIEKRVFGLMNEARYPIALGKWQLEPSVEFNILGYQQRGHEEAKEYALNIQSQSTYSVEGGIGLYVTREEEFDKDSSLKLSAGMAAYHEFADPYRVRIGMNGMDGFFTLRDEKRSDNRGVIRAGFDYVYRDLSLYGSLISYIDKEARTSAKTGLRWKF